MQFTGGNTILISELSQKTLVRTVRWLHCLDIMQQKKIIELTKHTLARLSKQELIERCEGQALEITKLKDELAKKDDARGRLQEILYKIARKR